jgi:hypothetical protein
MIIIKIQTYGSGCPGCSSSNIRLEWLPSSNWGPDPSRLNKSPFVDDDGGGGREEARKRKKKSQKEMKEKRERERERGGKQIEKCEQIEALASAGCLSSHHKLYKLKRKV